LKVESGKLKMKLPTPTLNYQFSIIKSLSIFNYQFSILMKPTDLTIDRADYDYLAQRAALEAEECACAGCCVCTDTPDYDDEDVEAAAREYAAEEAARSENNVDALPPINGNIYPIGNTDIFNEATMELKHDGCQNHGAAMLRNTAGRSGRAYVTFCWGNTANIKPTRQFEYQTKPFGHDVINAVVIETAAIAAGACPAANAAIDACKIFADKATVDEPLPF
jgi:hypothetical protein